MHQLTPEQIDDFGRALNDKSLPLKARFRALFALRNVGNDASVDWIGACLGDESALLKHELAYCLGQMQNKHAIPILMTTLRDTQQEPMVRHEAGEALGAIGDPSVLDELRPFCSDPTPEVAETCFLAVARIEYVNSCGDETKSPYDSVDPTPSSSVQDVEELRRLLCDASLPLWDRYRAMFTLRNINTDKSISALASGLYCEDSALFRHEVAYVLGQLQSPVAIQELKDRLLLKSENCMVRHECAEALGAIATAECTAVLEEYAKDEERVVRESCEVALDMADYENSQSFQYATMRRRAVEVARQCYRLHSRSYSSCQASFPNFTSDDVAMMYTIDKKHYDQLNLRVNLPHTQRRQAETLAECASMVRAPLVEVCEWINAASPARPSIRLVLWGPFGTGKSLTLNQACTVAVQKNWAIVYLRSAMDLTRQVQEVEMSTFTPGRINDPNKAVAILNEFKLNNAHIWKKLGELKTSRAYEWTKKDRTEAGRPLTEIIEMGLSAPFLSSDCVGGLFRELRLASSNGSLELLVAIDNANGLWGKTLVRRADRKYASPTDLTLVQHYRRLIENDWSNGLIVLVGDKKEIADARDKITVPRNTPQQVFGLEGFQAIEPFVPVETTLYSEEEVRRIHEYLVEKKWLTSPQGRSEDGLTELKYLSAFNPFYFERLCAFI